MSEFLSPNQTDYSPQALEFVSLYNQRVRDDHTAWWQRVELLRAEGYDAAVYSSEASKILGWVTLSNRLGISDLYTFTDKLYYGAKIALVTGPDTHETVTLLEPVPKWTDTWYRMTFKFALFNPDMKYWTRDCYATGKDETELCSKNIVTGEIKRIILRNRVF